MLDTNIFIDALRKANYRITSQRRAICEYLAQTKDHPTPMQAYLEIAEARPDVSRATVYNTLNVLQDIGAIVEITFGGQHTQYETDLTPHLNLICIYCHEIDNYYYPLSTKGVEDDIFGEMGFHCLITKTEIHGLCKACHNQSQRSAIQV